MMKNAIRLFLILVLLNAYQTACKFETYEEKRAKEDKEYQARLAKEEAKRSEAIAELKTTYNSDDTWDKGSVAWTADLQDRLVRPDGRPIVGIARLRDVEKWDKQYRVYLVQEYSEEPGVEFRLKCFRPELHGDPPISSRLMQNNRFASFAYPEYVFAARIHSVKRNDILTVEGEDSERATYFDTRPQFVAEGECLALKELIQEKPPASKFSPSGRAKNR
jgi:hypothetical protein